MSVNYNPATPSNGLVLCLDSRNPRSYPGSGTTWFDISGNNNHGTLTNGPVFTSNGFSFDGTNDFVNFGDILDSVFVGSSAKFTLSAWINVLSTTATMCIFGKIADSSFLEDQRQILFYLNNRFLTALWYGALNSASYVQLQCPVLIPLNTWTYVAMNFDATIVNSNQKCNLFINGNLVNYNILLSQSSPSSIPNGTAPLAIGASVSTNGLSSTYLFNGSINDSRIYNRVLSNTEIQQLFQAQRGRYGV